MNESAAGLERGSIKDDLGAARALEARNPLSRRRRNWVVVGVLLGILLAAIEQTVVTTAMPTLVATLGGLNLYSWVFSIYLLTSTVSVPLWGRLADMYGRKRYYVASIGLFLIGSILAGQSHSMAFLVFARAIQGLGAGGVFPIGSTILSDIYSLEDRARIQGVFSSVWGIASMVGPLAGGLITDLLSWRWVFYINVPFGLAAIYVIHRALTEPPLERPEHTIDLKGVLALSASVTLLLVALIEIGKGERGSRVVLLALGSAVTCFLFVLLEKRAREPLLPLALFRNRVFSVSSAVGFFTGMGLYGALSFVPLFVQGVLFGSATRAGSALTPLMLTWVTISVVSGWLILRAGYRPLIILGTVLFGLGFAWLDRLGPDATYTGLWLAMGVIGAGLGFTMVTMLLGVQNSVPRKLIATGTSATIFFRSIGGTIGVAIMGAVLTHHLTEASRSTSNPALIELASRPDSIVQDASRAGLSPEALEWLRHALSDGLESAFFVGLVIAVVAFLASLSFPRGSARELAERREGVSPGL
jgi:EmrB/QacA subfamily drug resistance transporter